MPGIGVAQDLVEAQFLRLAGEDRNALRLQPRDLFGQFGQHGEAARDMKAADRHRQTGGDEGLGKIGGVRKLVRLHADKGDQRRARHWREYLAMILSGRMRMLVSS